MDTYSVLLSTFIIGSVYSIIAILVERLLIAFGVVRGNTIGLVIVAFFTAFLTQWGGFKNSIILFGLLIIIGGPIGVNRADFIDTLMKGRWWWKEKKYENRE